MGELNGEGVWDVGLPELKGIDEKRGGGELLIVKGESSNRQGGKRRRAKTSPTMKMIAVLGEKGRNQVGALLVFRRGGVVDWKYARGRLSLR